jgi:hypothetical protein
MQIAVLTENGQHHPTEIWYRHVQVYSQLGETNGDGEKNIILYCWVMNIHVHLDIAVSYFKYATR